MLILIGVGFAGYGLYSILFPQGEFGEKSQLYAMIGVGLLFLIAGTAMRRK